jgi:WD40 repeat protein
VQTLLQSQAQPLKGSVLAGHQSPVQCIAISPDGRFIISGSVMKEIKIWSSATGQVLHTHVDNRQSAECADYSQDGAWVALGGGSGGVLLWGVDDSGLTASKSLRGHEKTVFKLRFSPDGQSLATASADCSVIIWDVQTGAKVKRLAGVHSNPELGVRAVAWSPDSHFIVTGGRDKKIFVWDVAMGTPVMDDLKGHDSEIMDIVFLARKNVFLTASTDDTMAMWELDGFGNATMLRRLVGHTGAVNCIAVSPDDKLLVSASADLTMKVWDLDVGRSIKELQSFSNEVICVAWSRGGEFDIASGGKDQTVRLWRASVEVRCVLYVCVFL